MSDKEAAERLREWVGDDPMNIEKLLPELRECVVEGQFGPMIKHPLVNEVFFHSWKIANEMYEAKTKRIAEMIAEGNRMAALWFYERPWRLTTMNEWYDDGYISLDEMREWLPRVWIDVEVPWQYGVVPIQMFIATGFVTDVEGKSKVEDFARGAINVYRGCDHRNRDGISWTRSAERAAWFAGRLSDQEPEVWKGRVAPSDILGIFLERGEDEVVVAPWNVKQRRRME